MKIDMHVHTEFSYHPNPSDAINTLDDIHEYGIRKGLDSVVLTDHMVFEETKRQVDLFNAQNPEKKDDLLILVGMEYHSDHGHILLYGIDNDDVIREFGKYGPAQNVIDFVKSQGGEAVIAHPYQEGYHDYMGNNLFDFVNYLTLETNNGTKDPMINALAEDASQSLSLKGTGGSDAHFPEMIGAAYTDFDKDITDMAGLLEELRAGNYIASR